MEFSFFTTIGKIYLEREFMSELIPVSALIKLPITWIRADDERINTVFKSLQSGSSINEPIRLLNCGCEKTYILEDGGHRISAAYKLFQKTGKDTLIPVRRFISQYK